jgi:hypothetical protein
LIETFEVEITSIFAYAAIDLAVADFDSGTSGSIFARADFGAAVSGNSNDKLTIVEVVEVDVDVEVGVDVELTIVEVVEVVEVGVDVELAIVEVVEVDVDVEVTIASSVIGNRFLAGSALTPVSPTRFLARNASHSLLG